MTIGVLALQGDFAEHLQILVKLNVATREVRLPEDLAAIDGLIIPGGESTTMANLLDTFSLRKPLKQTIQAGLPVWGTCAGMILLANQLEQDRPTPLGVMDITVTRNAFGRQLESFSTELIIKQLEDNNSLHATFIRAPIITKAGSKVDILASLPDKKIVAVRQNNMLATAFHPELTDDTRMHEYFLSFINK